MLCGSFSALIGSYSWRAYEESLGLPLTSRMSGFAVFVARLCFRRQVQISWTGSSRHLATFNLDFQQTRCHNSFSEGNTMPGTGWERIPATLTPWLRRRPSSSSKMTAISDKNGCNFRNSWHSNICCQVPREAVSNSSRSDTPPAHLIAALIFAVPGIHQPAPSRGTVLLFLDIVSIIFFQYNFCLVWS